MYIGIATLIYGVLYCAMVTRIMGMRLLIIVLLGMVMWGCVDGANNTDGVDFSSILMGAWMAPGSSAITFTETRITGVIGSLQIACNYRATAMVITLSNCDAGGAFAGNDGVKIAYTITDNMLVMTVLGAVFEYTLQNDGDSSSNDGNIDDDGNTINDDDDDDDGSTNDDDDNTDDDGNTIDDDDGSTGDDGSTNDDDDNTDDDDDGSTGDDGSTDDDGNTINDDGDDDDDNTGGLVGMWSATDSSTLTFTETRVTGILGTISVSCNYSATAMSATLSNCDDIPGIPISINGFTAAYTLAGDVLTVTFLGETREYTRQ